VAGASVLVGSGDIAVCGGQFDEATAVLVDSILKADSAAGVEDVVFTTGDNVYPNGAKQYWDACWKPSWGDTAKRIMDRIRPAVGNHDLDAELGAAFLEVFGDRVGEESGGYYSYDLGVWHVVVLNSEIMTNPAFAVASRRAQEEWLREDLAANDEQCTIAVFHRPRFSSGAHAGDLRMTTFWRILYERNVDIVLNGHEHHYERFEPQTPAGLPDTVRGITQFIVGTGGASLTGIRYPVQANSARRITGYHGVLKLTLGAGEYQHAFLDTDGRIWDMGAGKCH
jgi:hypothetical protein